MGEVGGSSCISGRRHHGRLSCGGRRHGHLVEAEGMVTLWRQKAWSPCGGRRHGNLVEAEGMVTLWRQKAWSIMGRAVSQLEAPFPLASSFALLSEIGNVSGHSEKRTHSLELTKL